MRLRLRLAHFKVKTNQINVPLSRLRISSTEPAIRSPTEASQEKERQPALPKLLPAPILRPTAYSSRTISFPQIPSSPPISPERVSNKDNDDEVFRTPALPRHALRHEVRQTSSPPESPGKFPKEQYGHEDDLTSSAIRGKAAIGLLGLRQER